MVRGRRPLTATEEALVRNVERASDALKEMRKTAWERHRILIERELDEARRKRDEAVREAAQYLGAGGGMSAAVIKRAMGTSDHGTYTALVNGITPKPWRYRVDGSSVFVTRFHEYELHVEYRMVAGRLTDTVHGEIPDGFVDDIRGRYESDWLDMGAEITGLLS